MVEITGEIDDKKVTVRAVAKVIEHSPNHFRIISEGKTSEIFLLPDGSLSDGNSIDGIKVTVESEKERIARLRFAQYKVSVKSLSKGMTLKASMPGMVKVVSVSIGDTVQKNTQVLILEAMKMENSITAGFTGIVAKINIEPGMSVERNAILMEFKEKD